jgi:glycine/D-amino acid oxidase-like deaminating enzyme
VREQKGVRIMSATHEIQARAVVIAAGAHSGALARQIGDPVPLDTGRGYHLEFDMQTAPVERPVCPTHYGFYFCPMEGRLRVAGTVELGGLAAPRTRGGSTFCFPTLVVCSRFLASRAGPGWGFDHRCPTPCQSYAPQRRQGYRARITDRSHGQLHSCSVIKIESISVCTRLSFGRFGI